MTKLFLLIAFGLFSMAIAAQEILPTENQIQYKYCELLASPVPLGAGLAFHVTILAVDIKEFEADTIFRPLLLEKKRPIYSDMSVPLSIMGSRGWKLIDIYSTTFKAYSYDHFIMEKKMIPSDQNSQTDKTDKL